jgi:hypothetical protein
LAGIVAVLLISKYGVPRMNLVSASDKSIPPPTIGILVGPGMSRNGTLSIMVVMPNRWEFVGTSSVAGPDTTRKDVPSTTFVLPGKPDGASARGIEVEGKTMKEEAATGANVTA